MSIDAASGVAAGALFGRPVRRVEDGELLRGAGRYVGDIEVPGVAEMAFVRSPIAHGRILRVDVGEAIAMPGVIAAWSSSDIDLPDYRFPVQLRDDCTRPALARDRVRFVGDMVAVVVAETKTQAVDAAEAVIVDYEPLEAVTGPEDALLEGAPVQFPWFGSNLVAGERSPNSPVVLDDAD